MDRTPIEARLLDLLMRNDLLEAQAIALLDQLYDDKDDWSSDPPTKHRWSLGCERFKTEIRLRQAFHRDLVAALGDLHLEDLSL